MPAFPFAISLSLLALASAASAQYSYTYSAPYTTYSATYLPADAPDQTQPGLQIGTNQCGTTNSQTSLCQNVYINSVLDFCLFAPPWTDGTNSTIGNTEEEEVSWCMQTGYGTRTIPDGTMQGLHFVTTPYFVQITGFGDLTKLNIPAGDGGGELDPHSWTGLGNPQGGLVFGTGFGGLQQYHEWTNFMSANEFCFRACVDGPQATMWCQHTYDEMGCEWNMPANYDIGTFTQCEADAGEPMGVYNNGSSTWNPTNQQTPVDPTPDAGPTPASSSCTSYSSVSNEAAASPTVTASMYGPGSSSTTSGTVTSGSVTSGTGSGMTSSRTSTSSGSGTASKTASASTSSPSASSPALNLAAPVGSMAGLIGIVAALLAF